MGELMQYNAYNLFFITMKGMKIMKERELSDLSNKASAPAHAPVLHPCRQCDGCAIEVHKTLHLVPTRYALKSYKLSGINTTVLYGTQRVRHCIPTRRVGTRKQPRFSVIESSNVVGAGHARDVLATIERTIHSGRGHGPLLRAILQTVTD